MEHAAQFDSTRVNLPGPDTVRTDRHGSFSIRWFGGAWPLLVREAIRLVNSDNERDRRRGELGLRPLSYRADRVPSASTRTRYQEVSVDNRSGMPRDVRGCTRATMVNTKRFRQRGWTHVSPVVSPV